MSPLEAVVLVTALIIPCHWLIQRELARADAVDPRSCGIVIVRERALDAHSAPIGEYRGHAIWRTVTFRGLEYEFNRVQPSSLRERLAAGELFLDPGLVYVARVAA